jgi:PAS domain S-box-containing protein
MASDHKPSLSNSNLKDEVALLKLKLQEAEDTLNAIRHGSVDALVVKSNEEQRVFTLESADYTYRILIESMNQGALTVSKQGTILYSNKQISIMLNRPLEHIIGSPLSSIFREPDSEIVENILQNARPTENLTDLVCTLASNPHMSVLVSATKLPQLEGGVDACVVITDITERKRAEDAKDDFIALASHQLRTPVTAVKQYIGMILQGYAGVMPENQRALLQTAYDSNERELTIINDILKTVQIDSGRNQLKKSLHNIEELIQDLASEFRSVLQVKGQNIEIDIEPGLLVHADIADLTLALTNLLDNATKYSPRDTTIYIASRVEDDRLVITVRDEGVGINQEDQQNIFNKFTRTENALSDTVNGNGLGLYWVKRIAESHGGDVTVFSHKNKGATFTLRIPQ